MLRYFRIVIGVCYDEAGHRLIKHPDDSVQTLILSTIRRVFFKATSWDHWNNLKFNLMIDERLIYRLLIQMK